MSTRPFDSPDHRIVSQGRPRRRASEPFWASYTDEQLLKVRLCDLGLRIEGTAIEERVERLYAELDARGIEFRPHCWLSEEWFSPDGVPGIAIPFYLAHPRLARLERRQVGEVEGGSEDESIRILRHEAGHALDTAYQLHRRRDWRTLFGRWSQHYPDYYRPRPYSRSYVQHLDLWYAQSHPAEDFAETFAVWLKPRSRWRSQYQGWPALKKLEYVDRLFDEVRREPPKLVSRRHSYPLRELRKTLGQYYRRKRTRYGLDEGGTPYDRELRRLFSDAPEYRRNPSAAKFLRRLAPEIRRSVAQWTGEFQYTINSVIDDMVRRCRELGLRLDRSECDVRREALVLLTVQIMNYLHEGHHQVAL